MGAVVECSCSCIALTRIVQEDLLTTAVFRQGLTVTVEPVETNSSDGCLRRSAIVICDL